MTALAYAMARDPWTSGVSGDTPPIGGGWGLGGRVGRLGRVLGDGENPLRWGVPLGWWAGVRVRVHWIFILYALVQLIFTLPRHQAGVGFVLPLLGALFVLVLLHEAGRCAACRWSGGEADEVVLWPLGGLSGGGPAVGWVGAFWAGLGGLAVNLALVPVLGGAMLIATGSWRAALPNPMDFAAAVGVAESAYGSMPWWLTGLLALHTANLVLAGFNLVPMLPLDAGRVLHALVWRRSGPGRAAWVGAHAGLAAAAVLVLAGLSLADGRTLATVGVFGGVVCWMERRRVQFLAGVEPGLDRAPRAPILHPAGFEVEDAEEPDAPDEQDEVDRILEKISRSGMGALTSREKRVLKRATERSRETERPGAKSDQ